jgi:hypothetical protein
LPEDVFRGVVRHLDAELLSAFSPWRPRAWVDAILGVATFWIWEDAGFAGVKGKLRSLEKWIENWNRTVGEPEGVRIIPLRRTGYLTVCISTRTQVRTC